MTAKDQSKTIANGIEAQAAEDLAAVRGVSSVATSDSACEFEQQIQVARRIMRENRRMLRALAK